MKIAGKIAVLLFTVVCVTGCIDVKHVVKIKPDGSGTVEMTVLMSKMVLEQMKSMMAQMDKDMDGKDGGKQEMFKEEEAKQKAGKMGEGVTFLSYKKIETERGEGFTALYAFQDITKLKLDQNPSDAMPSNMPNDGTQKKEKEEIVFAFKKGKVSLLTIQTPKEKVGTEKENKPSNSSENSDDDKNAEMGMAMMKQFFNDMKITMIIDIQGKILKTNATHVNGTQITLMEMDFGKLIQDTKKFKEFSKANPKNIEESKKLMEKIPGIKIELNEVVNVEFK